MPDGSDKRYGENFPARFVTPPAATCHRVLCGGRWAAQGLLWASSSGWSNLEVLGFEHGTQNGMDDMEH